MMKPTLAPTDGSTGPAPGAEQGPATAPARRPRRLLLGALLLLLVLAGSLLGGGIALSQSGGRFSLGCWAITSAGGVDGVAQSSQFRMQYSVNYIGATETQVAPSSANFRLRTNHFGTRALLPQTGVPGAPAGDLRQYLPFVGSRLILLQDLCP